MPGEGQVGFVPSHISWWLGVSKPERQGRATQSESKKATNSLFGLKVREGGNSAYHFAIIRNKA